MPSLSQIYYTPPAISERGGDRRWQFPAIGSNVELLIPLLYLILGHVLSLSQSRFVARVSSRFCGNSYRLVISWAAKNTKTLKWIAKQIANSHRQEPVELEEMLHV